MPVQVNDHLQPSPASLLPITCSLEPLVFRMCLYHADVEDVPRAEMLFMRLLQSASSAGQLLDLLKLLEGTWASLASPPADTVPLPAAGSATGTPEEPPSVVSQSGGEANEEEGATGLSSQQDSAPATRNGGHADARKEHCPEEEAAGAAKSKDVQGGHSSPHVGSVAGEAAADGWDDEDIAEHALLAGETGTGSWNQTHVSGRESQGVGAPDGVGDEALASDSGGAAITQANDVPFRAADAPSSPDIGSAAMALHACWAALLARLVGDQWAADEEPRGGCVTAALRAVEANSARSPFLLTQAEALQVVAAAHGAGDVSLYPMFVGQIKACLQGILSQSTVCRAGLCAGQDMCKSV